MTTDTPGEPGAGETEAEQTEQTEQTEGEGSDTDASFGDEGAGAE